MDGEDEDPFASIAKLCRIPPSQELILRSCPFAREFEVFSDDGGVDGDGEESTVRCGTPVESTGIVMVSLPETPKEESTSRDDQYQTPPEEMCPPVSFEEQLIEFGDQKNDGGGETVAVDGGCADGEKVVDLGRDSDLGFSVVQNVTVSFEEEQRRIEIVDLIAVRGFGGETLAVDGGCTDGGKTVDLGKDTDLGFSEIQSILICSEERRDTIVDHGSEETVAVDGGCTESEALIDLGKDSDVGFLEAKLTHRIDCVVSEQKEDVSDEKPAKRLKLCGVKLELPECSRARTEELEESEERIIRTVEDSQSERVSPGKFESTESLEGEEVMWDEDFGLVSHNGHTEVIESESEQNHGVVGSGETTDNKDSATMIDVSVDKKLQDNAQNIDGIENGSSGTNSRQRRRELPGSILGRAENVADGGNLISRILSPDCLLNVVKVLAERCAPKVDNADMLEIAMRRGMIFPRPSWWPPEYRPSWWPEGYGED